MSYFHAKKIYTSFDDAILKITNELQKEGFGVLTEIDVQATLKKKLDVNFRKYKILGTCNPEFAYKALQNEEHIGVMLPCNIVVQEKDEGIEVAAINPLESMKSVGNEKLENIALEVAEKLKKVIENL